jgi:RsiW-degrading membrane proteinase PrsW (M82 family)
VVVSFTVNTIVSLQAGDLVASVLSAPIVEEAMKGLGILYAVRRKEIDGLMDGIVYAGWIAIGFAVVEDFLYLSTAEESGEIWQVFFVRVILTPFAHPLFTFWLGLAIGLAVSRNRKVLPYALWGYVLAVLTHMMWNGSLSLAGMGGGAVLLLAILLFLSLFGAVALTVAIIRTRTSRAFIASIPWLAQRYGVSETEVAVFSDWRGMLRFRRRLSKADRKRFDAIHVALARLMLLHQRPGPVDLVRERILADQLQDARHGV